MWPALFSITNAIALVAWAILLLAPRRPAPLAIVLYLGVGLLCLIYAASFAALFAGWADPARDAGVPPHTLIDYSVEGLKPFFRSDGGIVVGWTHYLALDLFTGLWIARDADHKGFAEGLSTLDLAKGMIDEGFHPMTMYFPLVVHGAMLIEPTETESKAGLDQLILALRSLAERARAGDESLKTAPHFAPRRRLDETLAARKPVLAWQEPNPPAGAPSLSEQGGS